MFSKVIYNLFSCCRTSFHWWQSHDQIDFVFGTSYTIADDVSDFVVFNWYNVDVLQMMCLSMCMALLFLLNIFNNLVTFLSFQSVIFHVEHHPQFAWYTQCVTFNFFPTAKHELAYNLFNIITLYGLPLLIISASYSLILFEISKKTRQSRGKLRLYMSYCIRRSVRVF